MFKNKLFAVITAAITFCSVTVSAAAYPWDWGMSDDNNPFTDPYTTGEESSYPPETSDTSEPPGTSDTSDTSDTSEPPPNTSDTSDTSDTSEVPPDTSEPDPPPPPPPVIRLNFYEAYLEIGEGIQLNAVIENNIWGDNPDIRFTSFTPSVAMVDDRGYIMAVGAGDAWVTAFCNGIQADAHIYVSKPAEVPEFLVLKQNSFRLKIGETAQIEAQLLPENVSEGYTITYESDNPEIAAVNENGFITALKTGEAAITVRGADLSENVSVTVTSDVAYATAKLDGYIYNGEGNPVVGAQLVIDALKAVTDTHGYFSFESVEQRELTIMIAGDNKAVCKLTPQGDTTVYLLYDKNSLTRLGSYEELVGHLAINKVTFTTGANVIMTAGETFELVYQYAPKDAPVTEIQYATSNEITAEVGQIDGVITAKAPGETDITITLNGGQAQAVCHVVVNPKESSEHSVLIVVAETAVFVAAVVVFIIVYRNYKKKLTRTLDKYDEEDSRGGNSEDDDE